MGSCWLTSLWSPRRRLCHSNRQMCVALSGLSMAATADSSAISDSREEGKEASSNITRCQLCLNTKNTDAVAVVRTEEHTFIPVGFTVCSASHLLWCEVCAECSSPHYWQRCWLRYRRRGQLGSASSHSNLQVCQRERGRPEERIKKHLQLEIDCRRGDWAAAWRVCPRWPYCRAFIVLS